MSVIRPKLDPQRLRDFLGTHGVGYKPRGASYVMTCPLCRKSEKLWMYRESGRFKCWVCAETARFYGAPEYALAAITGISIRLVKAELYGAQQRVLVGRGLGIDFGDHLSEDDEEVVEEVDGPPPPESREWPWNHYPLDHKWAKNGVAYLESRGVPVETGIRYDVRYCPPQRSLAFPVTVSGNLLGWQYRIIDPAVIQTAGGDVVKRPKAINVGIPRDRVVMFADNLISAPHAIVAEGPFDGLAFDACGGNVATLGKAVADGQVVLIRDVLLALAVGLVGAEIKKIYLALDPDAVAEVDRLVRIWDTDFEVHRVVVPRGYKDPGETPVALLAAAVAEAPRYLPGRHLPIWFG